MMADKAWKQFERDAAALIGGKRKWANSGERLDVESENFVGQCKLVQRLSLAELTALAVEMQDASHEKFGVVMTKLRAGKGRKTPMLVTMTSTDFRLLIAGCKSVRQVQGDLLQAHVAAHERFLQDSNDDTGPVHSVQGRPELPRDPAGQAEEQGGQDPSA